VDVNEFGQLVKQIVCSCRQDAGARMGAGVVGDNGGDIEWPESWDLEVNSWFDMYSVVNGYFLPQSIL
jgi:hypothetical protein